MSNRIERLQLSNFRGATRAIDIFVRADKPIALVFGENGTGKSTIADAIDFLCNHDFGSLKRRSGTVPRNHIVAAGGNPADLEVRMTANSQTWRATLKGGKPTTSPDAPPSAFVLRRVDITRIMEATDSERFKTLHEFITVPRIESAAAALRSACKAVESELERAALQRETATNTLEQFWVAEGQPLDDPLTWARATVAVTSTELQRQIAADETLLRLIETTVSAVQALKAAKGEVEQKRLARAALEQEVLQVGAAHTNADLLETLEAARAYLLLHPENAACPLCAKPEARHILQERVTHQLEALRQVQELHEKQKQSLNAAQQAETRATDAHNAWREAYSALATHVEAEQHDLLAEVTFTSVSAGNDRTFFLALRQAAAVRSPLAARIEQARTRVAQHNALRTHLGTIDRLADSTHGRNALSQRLHEMLAIVEAERKRYVEVVVSSISTTVARLYERIHPGEALGTPTFALKKNAASSLTVTGRFGARSDVPPVAYYSDAHLDSLGLCVYLALAKLSGNAIIVLDDVLMSLDDRHLERVMALLKEESAHFGHAIITTHSRAWFDHVRAQGGRDVDLIELSGWDLRSGMRHRTVSLAEDLDDGSF